MFNWLFWVVIVFLAIMAIVGLKKGLVKMIFSLVSLIVTIILTVMISPHVAEFLMESTELYDMAQEKTCEFIEKVVLAMEEEAGESMTIDELPLPEIIKDMLNENNNEESYDILGVNNLADYIGASVARMVVNAAAFTGTFLVIFIAIKLIVALLDLISKLPLINGVNKLAGAALGLVEAFVILWILCLVVTSFAGTEWGRTLLSMINESEFLSLIYNNNYLMRLASDVLKVILYI